MSWYSGDYDSLPALLEELEKLGWLDNKYRSRAAEAAFMSNDSKNVGV